VCDAVGGFQSQSLLQQRHCFCRIHRHRRVQKRQRSQNQVVGIEAIRTLAFNSLDFGAPQAWLDCAYDRKRDLILKGKNIVGLAVIALSPNVRSGCSINELPSDPYTICQLAHASFEHIAHAELTTDLLHVDGSTLVGKTRIARDDEKPPDAREACNDIVDHAVAEIVLRGIAAYVLKRQ
jgi:hypothetical protein